MTKEQGELAYRLSLVCEKRLHDLCVDLGVSEQSYYHWMTGKRRMQERNEAKIRLYLDKVLWAQESGEKQ